MGAPHPLDLTAGCVLKSSVAPQDRASPLAGGRHTLETFRGAPVPASVVRAVRTLMVVAMAAALGGCISPPRILSSEKVARIEAKAPSPGWWQPLYSARIALHPRDAEPDWREWETEDDYIAALLAPFVEHEIAAEYKAEALARQLWVGASALEVEMMWGRPHLIRGLPNSHEAKWDRADEGDRTWLYGWSPDRIVYAQTGYDRTPLPYPRAILEFTDGRLVSWKIRKDNLEEDGRPASPPTRP